MAARTQIDPMALLAGMAQQTEKKCGRDVNLQVNEPAMDAAISQWIEADRQVKKWDGMRTTAEAQILAFAVPARLAECRRMGKVESTVRVNGKISMTQKCQYCAVGRQRLPAIKQAFGADADHYFKPRTKLELKEAAAEDQELLGKLIKALGPEVFARSFTVKQFAEVTETFHNDFTLKPEVEAKAGPFMELEVLKAYKPSLRQ